MTKSKKLLSVALALLFLVVAGGGLLWRSFQGRLAPVSAAEPFYIRFAESTSLNVAIDQLAERGAVRDARALRFHARLRRDRQPVAVGTYQVRPGMTADEILKALREPVQQMVRIPEGWWIKRVGDRLERNGVLESAEYQRLAAEPERFQEFVSFQLPPDSLEGYLFPDTYDLPPLLGAEEVIKRQLRAFEEKVIPIVPEGTDLSRVLNIAAMVELEAALDEERPIIAEVIENRLDIGMRLQIDATVLYALQEWKELGPGVVNTVDSPYNTYRIAGLPPGPIGSPGLASIRAALEPAEHDYLYYVARPDRTHMFARTYAQHLANINTRRRLLRQQEAE